MIFHPSRYTGIYTCSCKSPLSSGFSQTISFSKNSGKLPLFPQPASALHPLLKPEKLIRPRHRLPVPPHRWHSRIQMKPVEKLHRRKPALIHIKMNIPLLKIRRHRLPHHRIRKHPLNLPPRRRPAPFPERSVPERSTLFMNHPSQIDM